MRNRTGPGGAPKVDSGGGCVFPSPSDWGAVLAPSNGATHPRRAREERPGLHQLGFALSPRPGHGDAVGLPPFPFLAGVVLSLPCLPSPPLRDRLAADLAPPHTITPRCRSTWEHATTEKMRSAQRQASLHACMNHTRRRTTPRGVGSCLYVQCKSILTLPVPTRPSPTKVHLPYDRNA